MYMCLFSKVVFQDYSLHFIYILDAGKVSVFILRVPSEQNQSYLLYVGCKLVDAHRLHFEAQFNLFLQ